MAETTSMRRAKLEAELKDARELLPKHQQAIADATTNALGCIQNLLSRCHREIRDLQNGCTFVAMHDLGAAMESLDDASCELDDAHDSLKATELRIADMESDLADEELWKGDAA